MKVIVSILFILIVTLGQTFAQSKCTEAIDLAQQLYVSGDYNACIQLVQESLSNCDFTSAEKEEAYILLAKANIELDNLPEIDANIKKILRRNPNFKAKAGIQSEDFYSHVRQFNVVPLFSVGLTASAVLPLFNSTKIYSVLDSVDYGSPYTGRVGSSLGGKIEVEPVKNISLTVEVLNTALSYERSLSKTQGWSLTYSENISYLEVPVYLKKSFSFNDKFFPYISAGAGLMRLSSSYANLDLHYDAVDPLTKLPEKGKLVQFELNQRSLRTMVNYEWLIGAGITYKRNNFRFSLDGRYCGGVTNIMDSKNRFGNAELIYLYNYIDNSVTLNKIQLGASVSYILKYTVKKRKDANN
jgi:hypothetical protein